MIEKEDLFSRTKMIHFLLRWGFKEYGRGNSGLAICGTCSLFQRSTFPIPENNDDDIVYVEQVYSNP